MNVLHGTLKTFQATDATSTQPFNYLVIVPFSESNKKISNQSE